MLHTIFLMVLAALLASGCTARHFVVEPDAAAGLSSSNWEIKSEPTTSVAEEQAPPAAPVIEVQ